MKKSVYFIVQIVRSLLVSTVIWYLFLKNVSFDFYGESDNAIGGMIIVFGGAFYLILTLVHIILGAVKVKEWHWWFILISLAISAANVVAGAYVAAYGAEFLNRTFGLTFNS